jgi:S1-C subfamily serine protease
MAEVLRDLSDALAATVEIAGSSVVRVEARRRLPASGIVWSSDGVIVTAHHIIERDENISIGLPDASSDQSVPVTLVGRDPTTDLAVLRVASSGVQASSLTPTTWAEPESLKVGHLVLALGRPGRTAQATLGIVSALGESWRTPAGGRVDAYLQTDLVMYPGFSGGPLVDVSGQVLGLNSSALLRGISVTVPTPTLRRVVETLLAHGHVRRGYLGVGAQAVRLPEALKEHVGQETGLLLISVEADGPAGRGGLLLGDTIVALEGQPVRHMDDLLALLSSDQVGVTVPVRIVRGGQVQEVAVTIGERA